MLKTQDLSLPLDDIILLLDALNSAIKGNQGESEYIQSLPTSSADVGKANSRSNSANTRDLAPDHKLTPPTASNASEPKLGGDFDTFLLDVNSYNDFGTPVRYFSGSNNPCGTDGGYINSFEASASGCHSTDPNDPRGVVWLPDYFLQAIPFFAKDLVVSVAAHEFGHAFISKTCSGRFPERNEEVTDALTVLRYGPSIIVSYPYNNDDMNNAQRILNGQC